VSPFALLTPGTGLRRYTRAHLRHDRDAAREEVKRLRACLQQTACQLGTAVVETQHEWARAERLQGDLNRALAANAAYANAVSTKVGDRDTTALEDQATEPRGIHAQPLWDALGDGHAVPVVAEVKPIPQGDPRRISDRFRAGEHVVRISGGPYRAATA
jgi:hypothetical protein